MTLDGAVALVTGGSRGIGRAVCVALAERGARVVVNYRSSSDRAAETVRALAGSGHVSLQADVADLDAVQRMFGEIHAAYGRLDVLVNNAAWTVRVPPEQIKDISDGDIDRMLSTNVKGAFFCSRAALTAMKATQRAISPDWRGSIVNVTSNSIQTLSASNVLYIATKAAVESLTRTMARAYADVARINAVAPGLTRTDLTAGAPAGLFEEVASATPSGRLCDPRDVANCVVILATELPMTTGQTMNVDGGRTL